jgi:hypothetical protein
MSQALTVYLARMERGLRGMAPGRRRLFVRELESHLLDEVEALGIGDEAAMEAFLSGKESPEELARELYTGDGLETTHRYEAALASGALIGLATGTLLLIQDFRWYLVVTFGLTHGLAVGSGLIWLRPRWQRFSADGRLAISILLGALLAIPLGFTRQFNTQGFISSRLYYGAFTGYLVERHSQWRPLWVVALETVAFTAFMLVLEFYLTRRLRVFSLAQVEIELAFNATIALAVLGAMALRRFLSGRYVLGSRGNNP